MFNKEEIGYYFMSLDEDFSIKCLKYGPFSLQDEDINHLDIFQLGVNRALDSLRIEHAKVLRVTSSISPFVDNDGNQRGMYFAQIDYVPKRE